MLTLKVGYTMQMISMCLTVFDEEDGFKKTNSLQNPVCKGCKRLNLGANVHILYAKGILRMMWDGHNKYAKHTAIQRCWCNINILPLVWTLGSNVNVRRESVPTRMNTQTMIYVIYTLN